MSTSAPAPAVPPVPEGVPLGIKEVTAALVKYYGLHEGLYDLFLEYQFAFGNMGPTPSQVFPSAVMGLSRLGVTRVAQEGPLTVDAAQVNPASGKKRPSKSKGVA